jgi:decaprenyl-phosphate phosphoribosyltransferase
MSLSVSSVQVAERVVAARGGIWPYVDIARTDHWFKNSFMVLGIVLAVFYYPQILTVDALWRLAVAVFATCLVASSNYVLNELLDGPMDALHPEKKHRPVPAGRVKSWIAYSEWLGLAAAGLALASTLNLYFALSALWLWVMGILYNVPPIRTKEWPYVDVLSESVNNPIRLLLGWFALVSVQVPPLSLVLSYWMIGAFFMAMKRFAELRHIGDRRIAAAYRRSFAFYTESRLLVSILFYATSCALFAGIFIVRYHLELILFVPFASGLFAYYLSIGLQPNSAAQRPEHLYRNRPFVLYLMLCFAVFVALMFTQIPALYELFNVEPSATEPLWRLG